MQLKAIHETFLPDMLRNEFGKEIFNILDQTQHVSVKNFAGSAPSVFAAELFLTQKKNILFLIEDKEEALYVTAEMEDLLGKENVLYFPATHLEPYQIEKTQNANLVLRTEVLNKLNSAKKPKIIVAGFSALSEKVLKKEDFKAISHLIKTGESLDFNFTEELLHQFNFNLTDFVSEPGEFSVRGGIVDVFSYSNEEPYRITFFGNEIESIKTFNIETQLTNGKVDDFQLVSNMNFAVSGSKVSLFELLPKDSFVVSKNAFLGLKKIKDFYEKAEEKFQNLNKDISHRSPAELFITEEVFLTAYEKFTTVDFTLDELKISGKTVSLNQQQQPVFHKNFELLIEDFEEKQKENFDIWISFSTEKQKERLVAIFEELGRFDPDTQDIPFKSFKSELHEGFVDFNHKISVYTDHQIFDRYQRFKSKNTFAKSEQLTLKDLMQMKVGDYITHIDHGIGKFMGLVKVNNNGKVQECFKLTYKNGDLLYVSIHSLHKISKYNGPDGREIVLSKLGSPAWKTLKQKTKAKVKQIAFDLIRLYAQRKTAKGFAFTPDSYLQNELEASFIYEDTPDQEKATFDVKHDMENDTVMDRLICGDVGFGKTEIAVRAAFKAATD
ncbi:MAG: CarD family transcriptional regulator, partial [Kaistella sp.]